MDMIQDSLIPLFSLGSVDSYTSILSPHEEILECHTTLFNPMNIPYNHSYFLETNTFNICVFESQYRLDEN